MMMAAQEIVGRRRVRIWLGELLIAEYVAEPERASRYQKFMTPKFTGLRITVDAVPGFDAEAGRSAAELPVREQLWPLTVQ